MPCQRLNVPVACYSAAILLSMYQLFAAGIRMPCQQLNVPAACYSVVVLLFMLHELLAAEIRIVTDGCVGRLLPLTSGPALPGTRDPTVIPGKTTPPIPICL